MEHVGELCTRRRRHPGLIAGQLSRTLSLFDIALGYGAPAALACLVTLVTGRASARPRRTPGPGVPAMNPAPKPPPPDRTGDPIA
jgi:hypothetical protein